MNVSTILQVESDGLICVSVNSLISLFIIQSSLTILFIILSSLPISSIQYVLKVIPHEREL